MQIAYRYDENGFYVEDVIVEEGQELPENCTFIPMPQPIHKPLFFNGKWIDAITEEELEAMKPVRVKTPEERIEELERTVEMLLQLIERTQE